MSDALVIIVGGGAAGLSAAHELRKGGIVPLVIEARERLGGRIFTSYNRGDPIELGAEFIHGKSPHIWELIRAAQLPTRKVPDRHWQVRDSKLSELHGFWDGLEKVFEKMDPASKDNSFKEFLQNAPGISAQWKELARDFVEGFNAARAERISVQALARDQEASEEIEGEKAFRITRGYSQIIQSLEDELKTDGVPLIRGTRVKAIRWADSEVIVEAEALDGPISFEGAQAIVTLPLGVLKAGDVQFEPELKEKKEVIEGLAVGTVLKINLQFHSRFWPARTAGFIHANNLLFPTWWTHERTNLLTGWVGGPKAEGMASLDKETIVAKALQCLAQILQVDYQKIEEHLEGVYFHHWAADACARGAYTYVPVGLVSAQRELAEPIKDTLFFAGEAASLDGQLGTVHGAIASGKHAARQVLHSLEMVC